MLTTSFKEEVLLQPLRDGFDSLLAVVGYATPSAVLQHLTGGSNAQKDPHFESNGSLRILYGMYGADGITSADHDLFRNLQTQYNFRCRYRISENPIHAKVYVWSREGEPGLAYVGSGNYTQSAMRGRTLEAFQKTDPITAFQFCSDLFANATPCESVTELLSRDTYSNIGLVNISSGIRPEYLAQCPSATLPLTANGKGMKVPPLSGLNWGQREKRERNQAYIAVPSAVNKRGFFPELGEFFTVLTDDGHTFQMSRNQQAGKALHTPNNSEIGRYFRRRLGLSEDSFVTIEDLNRYGRIDVEFFDLGQDTYYMDFSPSNGI